MSTNSQQFKVVDVTHLTTTTISNLILNTVYSFKVIPGDFEYFDETKSSTIEITTLSQDVSHCSTIIECYGGTYAVINEECVCICNLQCEQPSVLNSTSCYCNYCQDQIGNVVGEGKSCYDGDACTLDDYCTRGICNGQLMNCTSNNKCEVGSCSSITGQCETTKIDNCFESDQEVDNIETEEEDDKGSNTLIVAIVVPIVIVALLTTAAVIFYFKYYKQGSKTGKDEDIELVVNQ